MPFHLNRVELIGRLGQDPDLHYTSAGQAVTTFSIATDRPAKSDGESATDWHQVVCWEKLAEFTNQYLTKGRLVFVAVACSTGRGKARTAKSGVPPRSW